MKQTGEILKSARESKKLSLHEIGMSLKINPKTLQAIEDGDTSKLPQKTFLRGFVKSYAQYLKLDTQTMMLNFDRETAGEALITPTPEKLSTVEKDLAPAHEKATNIAPVQTATTASLTRSASKLSERAPSHVDRSKAAQTQRMIFILVGICAVTLIVVIAKLVNKYQKERSNHPKSEIAHLTGPEGASDTAASDVKIDPNAAVKSDTAPPVGGEVSTDAAVSTSSASAAVSNAPVSTVTPVAPATAPAISSTAPTSPTAGPAATPEAKTEIPVKASSENTAPKKEAKAEAKSEAKSEIKTDDKTSSAVEPTKTSIKSAKTAETPKSEDSSASANKNDSTTATSPGKPQEVIVEATGKVSIKYQLDNGATETVEMNMDDMHTFKCKNNMVLEVSNASAINVIVNGRFRGNPGKSGPIKLRYPK